MKKPHNREAVRRAIDAAGGPSAIARALAISPQAVVKWPRRLPAERVLDLERLAGGAVTRHELRPDIYPEVTP